MNSRTLAAAAAAALTALSIATPATDAGPPGQWTQVTQPGSDIGNTMRVGLARTPDGVLHVGWTRVGATTEQVVHSAISADAKSVSGPDAIFTNTEGGVNPSVALVRDPAGGLRAFFGATNQFDGSLGSATSADGGAWSGAATASFGGAAGKPVYAAGGIGAGVGLDGTWYSVWGDSAPGGGGLHVGLDPALPDQDLPSDVITSDPGIGVDAAGGQVVAAWNQVGTAGVTVMPVGGAASTIPDSVGQVQNRAAITGRNGKPGVFVAYTRGTNQFMAKPSVYRVDTGARTLLSKQDGEDIAIAAGPAGRLWVLWKEGTEIHATRSNPAATRWGRIVKVKAPKGASAIYDLAGEGSNGTLDVLALVERGSEIASWHQRLLPGLTLKAAKGKQGKTVLSVTDAGAPVAGAMVKVKGAGKTTTSKTGKAVFSLGKGKHLANAAKKGYMSVALSVKK